MIHKLKAPEGLSQPRQGLCNHEGALWVYGLPPRTPCMPTETEANGLVSGE